MKSLILRTAVVVRVVLALAFPAAAQIEGGRSPSFSNIAIGFGARAMALGGAFIAIADDITAMNYNPAGLAQLLRPEFSLGGSFGGQTAKIPWADLSASMSDSYGYYFSSSSEISSRGYDFSYVGLVIPFKIAGLPIAVGFAHQVKGSNFNADYDYFYVDSCGATVDTSHYHLEALHTMYVTRAGTTSAVTFSLSARPLEILHLGFNLNSWRGSEKDVSSRQSEYLYYVEGAFAGRNFRVYEMETSYSISGGFSWDVGLLLKLRTVSIGLVYKSPFRADYGYDWKQSDIWNSEPLNDDSQSLNGRLFWPSSVGAGIAVRPLELLTVCGDYTSTRWSKGYIDRGSGFAPLDYPVEDPQDTRQIRAGVEYVLALRRVIVPVRAGWFDDRLYWNDAEGKSVKFTGLTAGTGLVFKNFILDLSAFLHFGSYLGSESDLAQTRQSNWVLLASVSYRLGR